MPRHDVKCKACGAITEEITVKGVDLVPADCECGGKRSVTYELWGKERERKFDGFTEIQFGGETFKTKEEWEAHRKQWKETHGEELHVRSASKREVRQEAEERLHRNIQTLRQQERRCGVDYSDRIRNLQNAI